MKTIADQLYKRLQQPLPGIEAQMLMSPMHRLPKDFFKYNQTPNLSSVLILLYFDGDIKTVFIKRTDDGRVHSGQISFPGGKSEPEDKDRIATALRETEEEIGVKAVDIKVLGKLTPLIIPVSNFDVLPVVGYIDYIPEFIKNDTEVQEVLCVSIAHLLSHENKKYEKRFLNNMEFSAPFFDAFGHKIWGATSMMLSEFLEVIKPIYPLSEANHSA